MSHLRFISHSIFIKIPKNSEMQTHSSKEQLLWHLKYCLGTVLHACNDRKLFCCLIICIYFYRIPKNLYRREFLYVLNDTIVLKTYLSTFLIHLIVHIFHLGRLINVTFSAFISQKYNILLLCCCL